MVVVVVGGGGGVVISNCLYLFNVRERIYGESSFLPNVPRRILQWQTGPNVPSLPSNDVGKNGFGAIPSTVCRLKAKSVASQNQGFQSTQA